MSLLAHYRDLIEDLGGKISKTGRILREDGEPFLLEYHYPGEGSIKGELVLPTQEILDSEEDSSLLKFHPACENGLRDKPSEIQKYLISMMRGKLAHNYFSIFNLMLEMASLNLMDKVPSTNDVYTTLYDMPELSQRQFTISKQTMSKLISAMMAPKKFKFFMSIQPKSSVKIGDETFSRAMEVKYPLAREFDEDYVDGLTIHGVKIPSKASYQAIKALVKGVLPEDTFYTSNETSGAYYNAFLKALKAEAKRINSMLETIKKIHPVPDDLGFSLGWIGGVGKVTEMKKKDLNIAFPGNEGSIYSEVVNPTLVASNGQPEKTFPAPKPSVKSESEDRPPFDGPYVGDAEEDENEDPKSDLHKRLQKYHAERSNQIKTAPQHSQQPQQQQVQNPPQYHQQPQTPQYNQYAPPPQQNPGGRSQLLNDLEQERQQRQYVQPQGYPPGYPQNYPAGYNVQQPPQQYPQAGGYQPHPQQQPMGYPYPQQQQNGYPPPQPPQPPQPNPYAYGNYPQVPMPTGAPQTQYNPSQGYQQPMQGGVGVPGSGTQMHVTI